MKGPKTPRALALVVLLAAPAGAASLQPRTVEAFDRYIREAEQRLDERPNFLWADESQNARLARQGQVLVSPFSQKPDLDVPGGLVHDWVGVVFIPGVTLGKTLAIMQDYNHKEAYRPEVMVSRTLARHGDDFVVYMRLLKKKIITVVLDTEHDVHYFPAGPKRWRSNSRTTRIAEVQKPGQPEEHALPPGTGQGFLWRLNSYWRFEERDGGMWVECEAISLTRDVPAGLGWIVRPIIRELPKESLEATLRETRDALTK